MERGQTTPSGGEGAQTTPSGSEVGHRLLPLVERPGTGSAVQMADAATAHPCLFGLVPAHDWRRQCQPTPVLLPGKSHGQRSLVGCSPWGHYELDMTKRLPFHFSLSSIGEGNGNPLQCSCLENPRDGGAWWAAVYGVAQSRTRLKQLNSSN